MKELILVLDFLTCYMCPKLHAAATLIIVEELNNEHLRS